MQHRARGHAPWLRRGSRADGLARMATLWATVGIMTVGFGGLTTSITEATTAPHGVAPKGISELWGVSCPTVTRCVAVGTATGSTQSQYIPGATATVNGGASWTKGTLKGGPNRITDVSCATTKRCVAVGSTGSEPGAYTAGVATTNNGGLSWTGKLLAGTVGELSSISCPSTTRCVAVGGNIAASGAFSPIVLVSSDRGASWKPGTLPAGTGLLADASCPSTNFCLAVGTSLTDSTNGPAPAGKIDVIYSKDGGSRWTAAASPGTGGLNAVSCATSRELRRGRVFEWRLRTATSHIYN